MALDKTLKIYDEQGNEVDYDILAKDVKFLPDGKDLPTKLAEMEEEIGEGGYTPPVGGIPKTDLSPDVQTSLDLADTAYQKPESGIPASDIADGVIPNVSGLATKTEVETGLAAKVDKNGTDSLMTAAEHTKLGNLPTADQLSSQMNAKANDNAVVKTISVNGGTPATPVNGNVDISVEGGGSVESVTVSGTKYTPDINGDVNLGDLRGQDGNSGVASADGVESVNNLNGGTTDTQSKVYVLGANQGKRLRDQIELIYQRIQTLYGLLGNIAFWDGKPSASALLPDLDWGAPKHAVAITNSLSNSVITRNGDPVSSSFQAEEGSTVTLIVAPASGYALTNVSYVKDGGSSTSATSLGDGTYKIEFVMGGSNVAITVSGTAQQAYGISYTLTGCAAPSGVTNPVSILSGGTATIQLEASSGFTMPASLPVGAVTGATASYTRDALDDTKATLVLTNATGNVTVDIDGVEVPPELHLVLQAFIEASNGRFFIQGGTYNSNAKRRAMVVVKRSETSNPCTWGSTDGVSEDPALEAEYSAIPIPSGATQVTMKCNSTYYYIVGLLNSSGVAQNADLTWTIGSTQKSWTLEDYPNATHILLNFKIGNGGTTQFTDQTWETMGIDFNIE